MPRLRLEGIGHRLLDPVDLKIAAGERVFIHGPSGSGKSLLLRAIADLDPHSGEVWLDDRPRSHIPAPQWRRRVGLLPAESAWWAGQVGEHLSQTWSNRAQTTPTSQFDDWLGRLGFDREVLVWSIARLSSGERQRLGLLRLLTQMPQALLLDEPTANLDPENAARVERLIADYQHDSGAPALWISHDPAQRQRLAQRSLGIRNRALVAEP